MSLHGKTALVTGAGRGIGLGCAVELGRAGAEVIINDRPGSPDLEAAAQEVRTLGVACHTVAANVFERSGCELLLAESLEHVESIDILVSNPASGHRCPFLEFEPDEFERIVKSTLTAGFHMSQLVARHMAPRGSGKIIFISSVQAEMPFANSIAYGAAKAGLNHMARTISVELAPYHINVNSIEPGWIDTPGERTSFTRDTIAAAGPRLPWGRLGTPTDIGSAVSFLASDAADYITGATIVVDGGFRFKDCRPDELI